MSLAKITNMLHCWLKDSRNSLKKQIQLVPRELQLSMILLIVLLVLDIDAATIAKWKDSLNYAWADLGELIDTRNQMLEASRELHKYFHDCKDVLSRILEKQNSMSDELGRDGASVSMFQRKHQNFLQDLSTLQSQVEAIQEDSAKLQAAYAGEKAMEITNREREVVRAWMELQAI